MSEKDPLGLFDDEKDPLGLFKEDEPSFLDKAAGFGEAALSTASGIFSTIPKGIRAAGELAATGGDLKDALDRSESSADFLQYKPRTKKGKEYEKEVQDTLQKYQREVGEKVSHDEAYLAQQKLESGQPLTAGDLAAENKQHLVGDIVGNLYAPGVPLIPRRGGAAAEAAKAAEDIKNMTPAGEKPAGAEPIGGDTVVNPQDPLGLGRLDINLDEGSDTGPVVNVAGNGDAFAKGLDPNAQYARTGQEGIVHPEAEAAPPIPVDRFGNAMPGYDKRSADLNQRLDINLNEGADTGGQPVHVDSYGNALTQFDPKGTAGENLARQALDHATQKAELARQLAENKQREQQLAASHDEFIGNRLRNIDKNLTDSDTVRDAELQRMHTQEIVDRLDKLNEALDGLDEFNKRYGSTDRTDVFDKAAEGSIKVDPQGQAFRGDFEGNNALGARVTTDAMNKEAVWMKGQGTPAKGTPLRPLQDFDKMSAGAKAAQADAKATTAATGKTLRSGKSGSKKGQQGGVTLDLLTLGLLPKKNPLKNMGKQKDGTFIPDDIAPEALEAALNKARGEQDGRSFKNMESGATSAAMKRASTAIGMLGDLVQNAFKRADHNIHGPVLDSERALTQMSIDKVKTLAEVFRKEMFQGEKFDKSQLGILPADMQNAYRKMRDAFDKTLEVQNEGRAARGLKPVTPMEAYLSSRWQGAFRRPLFDSKGKLVWYLAADNKVNLNAQTRAVLREHPELVYDPAKDHVVKHNAKHSTDLDSAYTVMLDILGRDDPAVEKIRSYMENQTEGQGATYMQQEKHFKGKGNIRGFVGDRPQLRVGDYTDRNLGPLGEIPIGNSAKSEAIAMFEQQIQYMKNGLRYAELQKISPIVKKILNDPELVAKQPRNMAYMRDYWKQALGYGENAAIRGLEEGLKDFGVSVNGIAHAVGSTKAFFILQKIGASVPYWLTQGLQLTMIAPHMLDLAVKGKFVSNPIKALISGTLGGLTMGTGHMFNAATGKARFEGIPGADFFNRAYRYAEDNGITARSVYDEAPLDRSFSNFGKVANTFGKTITIPETYVRSTAFMTLAQFLKDSGKYKSELDVFKEAEKRTNFSMVDYASTEKPMVFQKLGVVGNFLNTLQTYPVNYYNQLSYFMREAGHGNIAPFMAAIAVQYLIAGLQGVPLVEDIYKSYMKLKDLAPAETWMKLQQNEFLREPKLWLLKHGGTSTAYSWLSDKLGVNMQSRLSAPSAGQMLTSPFGPAMDIGGQLMDTGKMVLDPTNRTKAAQAAYSSAPTGTQGLLETAPQLEGINHNKRPDGTTTYTRPTKMEERSGLVNRTPEEETTRKFGFRSMRETIERDVNYANKRDADKAKELSTTVPGKFYDAVRRGDTEQAKDWYKTYVYVTGKGISQQAFEQQIEQEFLTDSERGSTTAKKNLQGMLNAKRARDIFEAVKREVPTNENK